MSPADRNAADGADERFEPHDEPESGAEAETEPAEGEEADGAGDQPAAPSVQAIAAALEAQGRAGANWFYWIAALSVVNSALQLAGAEIMFVIGLAVTLFIDGFAGALGQQVGEHAGLVHAVAIGLNVMVVGVVLLFGWLSNLRFTSVFLLGMVLYLLDGLLFLAFGDLMSAGFHAFALFCMWRGFAAYRQLNALLAAAAPN